MKRITETVLMGWPNRLKYKNIIPSGTVFDSPWMKKEIPIEVVMDDLPVLEKAGHRWAGVGTGWHIAGLGQNSSFRQCCKLRKSWEIFGLCRWTTEWTARRRASMCKHVEIYRLAEDMGLFLTFYAGEDAGLGWSTGIAGCAGELLHKNGLIMDMNCGGSNW